MKTDEITGVNKIYSNNKIEIFEYRDMYNDVKTIEFPKHFDMTEKDIVKHLENQQ